MGLHYHRQTYFKLYIEDNKSRRKYIFWDLQGLQSTTKEQDRYKSSDIECTVQTKLLPFTALELTKRDLLN
jgi:hypothetical protein